MNEWFLGDSSDGALVRLSRDSRRVEMWMTRRLPFEPKGLLLDARNLLRTTLSKLIARPHELLDARYTLTHIGFVDTENVLFYNVGAAAFSSSCSNGLRFARAFATPPGSHSYLAPFHHHHSYRLGPVEEIVTSNEVALTLRFSLPRVSITEKAHDYWWAAKQGQATIGALRLQESRAFSMIVAVTGPTPIANCAAILKPLFDGVIAALHYDSTVDDQSPACQLLGRKLGVNPASVANALCAGEFAILGERRVIAPYRNFVKWNPEDELCVTGQLLTQCHLQSEWTIEATIT